MLYLYAFDTLIIPAVSAEYKRAFSTVKKLITPERNRPYGRDCRGIRVSDELVGNMG